MNNLTIRDGAAQTKYAATAKGDGSAADPFYLSAIAPVDYPPNSPISVTVLTTSTVILVSNANRRGALIQNRGTVNLDLFFDGSGAFGVGFLLEPGDSYEINSTNLHTSQISAVAQTGSGLVVVAEGV
jgi:hypothetical protein